ncbi:hypothetical protein BKA70DRAFT_1442331 [Coprinopsis sp. MPI-PUGE-AT-0042]|nr:hypothetical protein BKA70DRAFT_1442331 [Coprinopsis sp. MPI-PUGE-AT-0042]
MEEAAARQECTGPIWKDALLFRMAGLSKFEMEALRKALKFTTTLNGKNTITRYSESVGCHLPSPLYGRNGDIHILLDARSPEPGLQYVRPAVFAKCNGVWIRWDHQASRITHPDVAERYLGIAAKRTHFAWIQKRSRHLAIYATKEQEIFARLSAVSEDASYPIVLAPTLVAPPCSTVTFLHPVTPRPQTAAYPTSRKHSRLEQENKLTFLEPLTPDSYAATLPAASEGLLAGHAQRDETSGPEKHEGFARQRTPALQPPVKTESFAIDETFDTSFQTGNNCESAEIDLKQCFMHAVSLPQDQDFHSEDLHSFLRGEADKCYYTSDSSPADFLSEFQWPLEDFFTSLHGSPIADAEPYSARNVGASRWVWLNARRHDFKLRKPVYPATSWVWRRSRLPYAWVLQALPYSNRLPVRRLFFKLEPDIQLLAL